MSVDLRAQLHELAAYMDELQRAVSVDDVVDVPVGPGPVRPLRVRQPIPQGRRWVMAMAGAAVVLLVGGLAWLAGSLSRQGSPVVTQPSAPTTIPETSIPTTSAAAIDEEVAKAAVSAVEAWVRAVNDVDLEGAYDLTSRTIPTEFPYERDRMVNRYALVYPANGTMLRVEGCEVTWFDDSSTERSLAVVSL